MNRKCVEGECESLGAIESPDIQQPVKSEDYKQEKKSTIEKNPYERRPVRIAIWGIVNSAGFYYMTNASYAEKGRQESFLLGGTIAFAVSIPLFIRAVKETVKYHIYENEHSNQ
jgi:hypothetical protein